MTLEKVSVMTYCFISVDVTNWNLDILRIFAHFADKDLKPLPCRLSRFAQLTQMRFRCVYPSFKIYFATLIYPLITLPTLKLAQHRNRIKPRNLNALTRSVIVQVQRQEKPLILFRQLTTRKSF